MDCRLLRVAGAILLLLLSVGCSAPSEEDGGPTPTPVPTPLLPTKPTYTVQRGEIVNELAFNGRIQPARIVELAFRASGRVRSVQVARDDRVEAGQVLADLEIDAFERSLAQADLDLERARARLLQAGHAHAAAVSEARTALEIRELQLGRLEAQDPSPAKRQAEADLAQVKLARDAAQARYNAVAWRNDVGATPEAGALQQATLGYQKAQAAFDLAVQAIRIHDYDLQILAKQVDQARQALDRLGAAADPLLANDVRVAELVRDGLAKQIADARILAPFAGQIVAAYTQPGQTVQSFQPLFVLADPSELEVRAELANAVAKDLQERMPASIASADIPDRILPGSIRQLPVMLGAKSANTGVTQLADLATHVKIDGDLQAAGLKSGDLVKVTVVLERKSNVLWLPRQALRSFEGRDFVVVQDRGMQRRVDVVSGLASEQRVEIKDGLTEGQVVLSP